MSQTTNTVSPVEVKTNTRVPANVKLAALKLNNSDASDGKAWIAAGCSEKAATKDWMRMRSHNLPRHHIYWSTGMGAMSDGSPLSALRLQEKRITRATYTPSVFSEVSACDCKLKDELDNVIFPSKMRPGQYETRQVKTNDGLADLVVISEWEFELRFYKSQYVLPKQNGLYGVVSEPFKVYKFKNPNPPALNRFQIIEMRGDAPPTVDEYYYEEATDTWTLFKNGKIVSKKPTVVNPQNSCEMIMTRTTYEPNGGTTKRVEYFRAFPWGIELMKTTEDADGKKPQTTLYTYYEDETHPNYSFKKTVTHPDARVTKY